MTESQAIERFEVPSSDEGVRLSVSRWGRGGTACIFVHGFAEGGYVWKRIGPRFARDRQVVALDLRGHGDSGWDGERRYTPRTHAADLQAVISRLDLKAYVLIGHSLGGAVALHHAAEGRSGLRGVILVDYGPDPAPVATRQVRWDFIESAKAYASVADYANWLISTRQLAPPEHLRELAHDALRLQPDGTFVLKRDPDLLRGLTEKIDSWALLAAVMSPVLVVRGSGSSMLSKASAEAMVRAAPNARLVNVPMAGHGVMTDNEAGFAAVIDEFLREIDPLPRFPPPGVTSPAALTLD